MTKIVLEIKTCKECPFFKSTPYRTEDSWERAENWHCKKSNDRKIAGYVEWHEEKSIKVPDWCPISIESIRNDKLNDVLND